MCVYNSAHGSNALPDRQQQLKEPTMNSFIITEKQNAQSSRKGETVQAANLSAAKRKASGMQMFKGTVLEISAENGAVLSRKEGGRWTDTI